MINTQRFDRATGLLADDPFGFVLAEDDDVRDIEAFETERIVGADDELHLGKDLAQQGHDLHFPFGVQAVAEFVDEQDAGGVLEIGQFFRESAHGVCHHVKDVLIAGTEFGDFHPRVVKLYSKALFSELNLAKHPAPYPSETNLHGRL